MTSVLASTLEVLALGFSAKIVSLVSVHFLVVKLSNSSCADMVISTFSVLGGGSVYCWLKASFKEHTWNLEKHNVEQMKYK